MSNVATDNDLAVPQEHADHVVPTATTRSYPLPYHHEIPVPLPEPLAANLVPLPELLTNDYFQLVAKTVRARLRPKMVVFGATSTRISMPWTPALIFGVKAPRAPNQRGGRQRTGWWIQISHDTAMPLDVPILASLLDPLLGPDWWQRIFEQHTPECCTTPGCYHSLRVVMPVIKLHRTKTNSITISGQLRSYVRGMPYP